MSRTYWLALAVGLALVVYLWLTQPQVTELLAIIVDPLTKVKDTIVGLATGAKAKAVPLALALRHCYPEGAGGLEGAVLAECEHETGGTFDNTLVNRLGYVGIFQTRPRYFADVDLTDVEAATRAVQAGMDQPHWNRVLGYTSDYRLAATLMYCSHGEGGAILDAGLHSGVTWDSFCSAVKAKLGGCTSDGKYNPTSKGARKADGFWNTAAGYYSAGGRAQDWRDWYAGLDFAALEAGGAAPEDVTA